MTKITKFQFLNAVLFVFICKNVVADLPIHGTIRDMVGSWRFDISKEVKGVNINCGSDVPNSLEGDLRLGDYRKFMTNNYGFRNSLNLELTLEPVKFQNDTNVKNRDGWISLAVKSDGNVVGSWTAVYDQGYYISLLDGISILSYFSFERIEENKYATNTNKSLIGWVSKEINGKLHHFCCYAEKLNPSKKDVFNTVDLTENSYDRFRKEVIRTITNGKKSFHPINDDDWNEYDRNYFCTCSKDKDEEVVDDDLPKNFSWDRFDNIPLVDQKKCGGCYTIASLYVLHSRFLIKVRKLLDLCKKEPDARLLHLEKLLKENNFDINDSLSCIVYNQGCKGGYPLNVGKYAKQYGLLVNNQDFGEIADNSSCYPENEGNDKNNLRLFAKNFGYVGGCYQCTKCNGENLIMREIFENGPVVVGVDGSYIRHYRDGIVNPPDTELRKHRGMCEYPDNNFLSGFEYTTHAITLMGWGETPDGFKYWVARNSWGKDWGDNGYFKLVRGKNAFGSESEAVFIDPDIDRVLNNTTYQPISDHNSLWNSV